ncbi:hypothetical protein PGTUg99_022569 [Puccinia graminis f. sp. tritici]|uniref:Uncharacterized protein n=1 Tax=Puccinia graminis f. sp. tritici TaxID=56615 RepID=A0A5B0R5P5_PUCGR|nr:hypothetical protein PGTUg99_022569 [Puccinia graminis f. sp. tritici]
MNYSSGNLSKLLKVPTATYKLREDQFLQRVQTKTTDHFQIPETAEGIAQPKILTREYAEFPDTGSSQSGGSKINVQESGASMHEGHEDLFYGRLGEFSKNRELESKFNHGKMIDQQEHEDFDSIATWSEDEDHPDNYHKGYDESTEKKKNTKKGLFGNKFEVFQYHRGPLEASPSEKSKLSQKIKGVAKKIKGSVGIGRTMGSSTNEAASQFVQTNGFRLYLDAQKDDVFR